MKKLKNKERDSIDFGKSRVEPLFHSIFYPTLLSMVFASLFTVADGIFVGQGVGSNALAAINIVAPLFLMTTGIALMFGAGVSVVASIHLSKGNNRAANITITQAFEVATLLITILAVTIYFFRIPFLRLMGCSDALLSLGEQYLIPILPGCTFRRQSYHSRQGCGALMVIIYIMIFHLRISRGCGKSSFRKTRAVKKRRLPLGRAA